MAYEARILFSYYVLCMALVFSLSMASAADLEHDQQLEEKTSGFGPSEII